MRRWFKSKTILVLAAVAAVVFAAVAITAYATAAMKQERITRAERLTGGNAKLGLEAMNRYGCASCHHVPGLARSKVSVAPPLTGMGSRGYVAGVINNTPDNLARWIMNPPAIDPLTAMPNLEVTETDAVNIAAYLYSLE